MASLRTELTDARRRINAFFRASSPGSKETFHRILDNQGVSAAKAMFPGLSVMDIQLIDDDWKRRLALRQKRADAEAS